MSEQAVAAKADMEAIRPINVVTWKDKLAAYKKRPLSMFLLMAVTVSAVITVGVLGALVIYILANGIMNLSPELFAWKYTTENVSMLPAIINTFSYDSAFPAHRSTNRYLFCYLFGRICQTRK